MALAASEQLFYAEVEYLTTLTTEIGTVVHIFNDVANNRLLVLLDDPTGKVEYETAIQRCVEVSKVECLAVPGQVMTELAHAPRGNYDQLLERFATVDFVRIIGGVFRARESTVPVVEMQEGQMIGRTVRCRKGRMPSGTLVSAPPPQSHLPHHHHHHHHHQQHHPPHHHRAPPPGAHPHPYGPPPAHSVHHPPHVTSPPGYGAPPTRRSPSPQRQDPGDERTVMAFQTTHPASRSTGVRPL